MVKNLKRKMIALTTSTLLVTAAFVPTVLANNYGGNGTGSGNKSFCFNGYQYVNTTTVKLFFSKGTSAPVQIVASQFTIKEDGTSTTVPVSSANVSSGSNLSGLTGTNNTNLTNGTTVTLTLGGSGVTNDKLYDLTMQAATMADTNKQTLANYTNRSDLTFKFKTPVTDGTTNYTGTPVVTFIPADQSTDVAYEPNVEFVVDRPVSASSVTTLLDNTSANGLSKNFQKFTDTLNPAVVLQDSAIDSTTTTYAECYTPHVNDAHNTFIFPETGNGNSTIAYNLDQDDNDSDGNQYTLTIPSLTDVNSHTITNVSTTFVTRTSDIPTWTDATPTVTYVSGTTYSVSWADSTITPKPTYFNVYYSSSQYGTSWTKANANPINGNSTTIDPLSVGTWYVRIVPTTSDGTVEAGFSVAGHN